MALKKLDDAHIILYKNDYVNRDVHFVEWDGLQYRKIVLFHIEAEVVDISSIKGEEYRV